MEEISSRQDCRLQASKNCLRVLKPVDSVDGSNIPHLPPLKKSYEDETDMSAHISSFDMSLSDIVKFGLLVGSLSLPAAQSALAAADFAGSNQLADFVGDFSDITTGSPSCQKLRGCCFHWNIWSTYSNDSNISFPWADLSLH